MKAKAIQCIVGLHKHRWGVTVEKFVAEEGQPKPRKTLWFCLVTKQCVRCGKVSRMCPVSVVEE